MECQQGLVHVAHLKMGLGFYQSHDGCMRRFVYLPTY